MGSTYEADGELVVNDAKWGTLFSASNERVPAAARAEALRGGHVPGADEGRRRVQDGAR
jgi:hypothetical protein